MRVHQYTMLCAPHVSQLAAVEALEHADDDVAAMVADYDRRRRVFVKGLRELGLDCPEPAGAFYAFPSIRRSGLDSETFAERLLHEHQVAVVPGNVFGPSGEGHVRCSYATALPLLEEALERMGPVPGVAWTDGRHRVSPRRCEHVSTRRRHARPGGQPARAAPSSADGRPLPTSHRPTRPARAAAAHRTADDARGLAWSSEHAPDGAVTFVCPACTRADIAQIEAGLPVRAATAAPPPDPAAA